jgi:hypothetical protein
VTTNNKI